MIINWLKESVRNNYSEKFYKRLTNSLKLHLKNSLRCMCFPAGFSKFTWHRLFLRYINEMLAFTSLQKFYHDTKFIDSKVVCIIDIGRVNLIDNIIKGNNNMEMNKNWPDTIWLPWPASEICHFFYTPIGCCHSH